MNYNMVTTLKDFLNEKKDYVYKKYMDENLGYDRQELPQFKHQGDLKCEIHDAFGDDVNIHEVKKRLKNIEPTQNEILESLLKKHMHSKNWEKRTYVISEDNHLVDGHHHWAVGLEYDPDKHVDCLKLDKPMDELMKIYEKRKEEKY